MEGSGFTQNPVEGAPAASAGAMNSTCGPFTSGPNLSRVAGQDLLDDMPPLRQQYGAGAAQGQWLDRSMRLQHICMARETKFSEPSPVVDTASFHTAGASAAGASIDRLAFPDVSPYRSDAGTHRSTWSLPLQAGSLQQLSMPGHSLPMTPPPLMQMQPQQQRPMQMQPQMSPPLMQHQLHQGMPPPTFAEGLHLGLQQQMSAPLSMGLPPGGPPPPMGPPTGNSPQMSTGPRMGVSPQAMGAPQPPPPQCQSPHQLPLPMPAPFMHAGSRPREVSFRRDGVPDATASNTFGRQPQYPLPIPSDFRHESAPNPFVDHEYMARHTVHTTPAALPAGPVAGSFVGHKPKPAKPLAPTVKFRTPAEVSASVGMAEVHNALLRDDFPVGPLQLNRESLLLELRAIAVNPRLGGGAHGLTLDGHEGNRDGCRSHGPRPRFACSHKSKSNCLWHLVYEQTTDGFMAITYQDQHHRIDPTNATKRVCAHDLDQTGLRTSAAASGRVIPPVLHELGFQLASVCSNAQVHEGLQKEAKRRGLDHTMWSLSDVARNFPTDQSNGGDFDVEGLIERLEKNKLEKGLEYKATVDKSSHLNKLFVEIDEARQDWAVGGKQNVLLFDPTHSTNRYGLKLCFFVTVGSTGQTVVLAFVLIKHENISDIQWAFRKFAEVFRVAPATLFTDGDNAIRSAYEAVSGTGDIWHGTVHLLCVYHLSKNFFQKVHPLFSHNLSMWKKVFDAFWRLAKVSDSQFAEPAHTAPSEADNGEETLDESSPTFEMAWIQLVRIIEDEGSGSTKEEVCKWLDTHLYQRKEMWAYCFTWSHRSWGVHSTQRAEATNSALKSRRRLANQSLARLCDQILDLNLDARFRKELDQVRLHLRQIGASLASAPLLADVVDNITPYALELVRAQMVQDRSYSYRRSQEECDSQGRALYLVEYNHTDAATESELQIGEDGKIKDFSDNGDFGIAEQQQCRYIAHRTTVDTCSCQLLTSLGIPCRHIFHLRGQQDIRTRDGMTPLLQLIGAKWHLRTASDVKAATVRLRVAPASYQAAPKRAQPVIVPQAERFSHLMEELRGLAEMGAEDPKSYEHLLSEIPHIADKLEAQMKSCARGARVASQDESIGCASASCNAAQPQEVNESTSDEPTKKDPKSFKRDILDRGHKPAHATIIDDVTEDMLEPMAAVGAELVGRWVAFKWAQKRQGKWMAGKIVGQRTDDKPHPLETAVEGNKGDNFICEWADGWMMTVNLTYDNMIDHRFAYVNDYPWGSWLLISDPNADDDVSALAAAGRLRDPQLPNAKSGPKQNKRLAPHAGPTSRQNKRHRG